MFENQKFLKSKLVLGFRVVVGYCLGNFRAEAWFSG
jgi:hypothetical protein